MRVVEINYSKPANLLISSLQDYCRMLMPELQANSISNLKEFGKKLWEFAETQQNVFPRCKLSDLDVIFHGNAVHEWYNLLYKDDRSMISIFARPSDIEHCFRDYDALTESEKRAELKKLSRFLNRQYLNEVNYKSKQPIGFVPINSTDLLTLKWPSLNS